jgi:CDP-6-deoxy-D-xylo-4-hexulose-3-dehydrase
MQEYKQILDLVKTFCRKKIQKEKQWKEGTDWVGYSGHLFSEEEYVAAVDAVLTDWLIFGKKCRQFEHLFPKHLGKKTGILTNSGSSANLLMVSALKSQNLFNLKEGDKIITPVVGFPTTINPIIQNGFKPVFVDVTIPDLNLDLDQVEQILEEQDIKAIMFAHVLGNPPDMDRLMNLVEKYKLIFLEDCCDALGSTYDGKKLGSYGHLSSCSFYPAHHMTMGEGGFVAADSNKITKIISSLRDWGRACYCNLSKPGNVMNGTACGNRFQNWLPSAPDITYDHRYVYSEIGYNLKPLEMQGAIGLQQLKKLESLEQARKDNFDALLEVFKPYKKYFYLPEATEKADPVWFAFLLTLKENCPFKRQDFTSHLEKNKIQTRTYFAGNILYHPAYNKIKEEYKDLKESFPVADLVTRNSFFIGTYKGITREKIAYIKKVVDAFFEERVL